MNPGEKVAHEISLEINIFYRNESRCAILRFFLKAFLLCTSYMSAIFIHYIVYRTHLLKLSGDVHLIKQCFCILLNRNIHLLSEKP